MSYPLKKVIEEKEGLGYSSFKLQYLGEDKWETELWCPGLPYKVDGIPSKIGGEFLSTCTCYHFLIDEKHNPDNLLINLEEVFFKYIKENIKNQNELEKIMIDLSEYDLLITTPENRNKLITSTLLFNFFKEKDVFLSQKDNKELMEKIILNLGFNIHCNPLPLSLEKMSLKSFHQLLSGKEFGDIQKILTLSDITHLNKYFSKSDICFLELKIIKQRINNELLKIKKKIKSLDKVDSVSLKNEKLLSELVTKISHISTNRSPSYLVGYFN